MNVRAGFGDAKGHTIEKTELEDILQDADIQDVFVCGLATDFCVAFTAKDAVLAGFNTFLITDACRGITPAGCDAALAAAKADGVHLIDSNTVPLLPFSPDADPLRL